MMPVPASATGQDGLGQQRLAPAGHQTRTIQVTGVE